MQNVHKSLDTKSRKLCSVSQCSSYCTKDISLHSFPSNPHLRQIWRNVLKIAKPLTKYMLVCSLHFTETDFKLTTKRRRRLLKTAIPSRKIPRGSHSTEKVASDRFERHWLYKCNLKEPEENVGDNQEMEDKDTVREVEQEIIKPSTSRDHAILETPLPNIFYVDNTAEAHSSEFFELPLILNPDEKMIHFTGK